MPDLPVSTSGDLLSPRVSGLLMLFLLISARCRRARLEQIRELEQQNVRLADPLSVRRPLNERASFRRAVLRAAVRLFSGRFIIALSMRGCPVADLPFMMSTSSVRFVLSLRSGFAGVKISPFFSRNPPVGSS